MIEAYKIGISVVLDSNASRQVGELAEQFEALNRSVRQTQSSIEELIAGMRGVGRIGEVSAAAWRETTVAIETAARAAREAAATPAAPMSEGAAVAEFEALDRVINQTRGSVGELTTAMRGLQGVGEGSATAWNEAAASMERAARMAQEASVATAMASEAKISTDVPYVLPTEQFDALNRSIGLTQASATELTGAMRGLEGIGTSSATAWKEAAASMEHAARMAQEASAASATASEAKVNTDVPYVLPTEQFDALNHSIRSTQASATELTGAMRGLEGVGASSATAWKEAAASMEHAAAIAREAAVAPVMASEAKVSGDVPYALPTEQFDELNRSIRLTQTSASELAGAMRGLEGIGTSSAAAWKEAAISIEGTALIARDAAAIPPIRLAVEGTSAEPFETLDRAIKQTQGSVAELATGMRGLKDIGDASAQAWNEAATSMERAARAAQHGGASMLPSPSVASEETGALAAASVGAIGRRGGGGGEPPRDEPFSERPAEGGRGAGGREDGGGRGGGGRGGGGLGGFFHQTDWTSKAMEDAIPAWMGGELIKKIWEATAEPAATMSHLRGMGFSEEQVEESRKSAQTTQQDILGSSYAGNLELISKLQSVIQDPEASIKAMPAFAGLGVVLDSYGHGNEGNELMNAIKAGEFRGVLTQVDPNTGKEGFSLDNLLPFIREVMATDVATHGSVGPGQILQFLRASGVSGRMIGDRALFADSMAVIQSMGAANAGRGLQALQLQYSAGKQSDAGVSMGIEMGIYRPSHRTKKGEIVDDKTEQVVGRKLGVGDWLMEPQAFADPAVLGHLRKDPAWFALEYLGPRLNTWVEKNYSDQLNRPGISAQEREELKKGDILGAYQMVTSRIPGGKYAGEIEASHLLLNRDRDALKSMLGIDPGTGRTVGQPRDILGIEQQNNPQVIQKGFEASWKAFEASLGESAMKPATDALNALTNILNRFSDWARKNPDGAEHALEGLAGGVALFGAGSLAAAAMATMTSGPASFLALAGGIEVLGRSLTSVPHWLIDMAAGAAAGAKLGGIGGLPGRAIGAVGGAAVGATIGIDPFHVDERVGNLLGGIFTKDDHKQQGPVPNPQATSQPGQQPAQQPQNQSIMLQGNVHLNNQVVGTFSAAQANAASRPPAGPTNPDPRFTLPSPGWTAVLP